MAALKFKPKTLKHFLGYPTSNSKVFSAHSALVQIRMSASFLQDVITIQKPKVKSTEIVYDKILDPDQKRQLQMLRSSFAFCDNCADLKGTNNFHFQTSRLAQTHRHSYQPQGLFYTHHTYSSYGHLQSVREFAISDLQKIRKPNLRVRHLDKQLKSGSSCHKNFSTASWFVESSPRSVQPYLRLIRFDKPIGTWLLYWPCTWSISIAASPGGLPDPTLLTLFGIGAFFMRGAGCIINDMWDKDFDGRVERTKSRPLAAGEVTPFQALVFLGTQLSCALAILLQLNVYSIILGASSMILVVLYPLAKRFTYWPQLVLGLTFNYGALLGYSAVAGSVDWSVCLPLYASCVLWTLIYDTIYAHQDIKDDLQIGVKSTAIALGDQTKPVLSAFTAAMASGLVLSGQLSHMTWPYYMAVGVTTARLYQQIYNINLDVAEECGDAFRSNFYLGVVMLTGIILGNYLKQDTDTEVKKDDAPSHVDYSDNELLNKEIGQVGGNVSNAYSSGQGRKDTVYFLPR